MANIPQIFGVIRDIICVFNITLKVFDAFGVKQYYQGWESLVMMKYDRSGQQRVRSEGPRGVTEGRDVTVHSC